MCWESKSKMDAQNNFIESFESFFLKKRQISLQLSLAKPG